MSDHNWQDITISAEFMSARLGTESNRKKAKARAFYRDHMLEEVNKPGAGDMSEMFFADFIYVKETQTILKNRLGSVEELYEEAQKYASLKYHPDKRVQEAMAKVETLAALIGGN